MSAKDENSEIFSYSKKAKCEFLARSHNYFFEQRVFKNIFAFVLMQMCACLKKHMRVGCVFALFACFAWAALLAGITKTATGKACNECKTLSQLGLVCV